MLKRITKDQRGIGLIIEIVIGAVVLGVVGLAVMQYMKAKSGTGTSLIPAGVTLNGQCDLNDTDLCKFTNNWKAMTTYTVKMSQTESDGKKAETTYEIADGNKFHATTSVDGKITSNMIGIAQTSYMLDLSDNTWWEQTVEKPTSDTVKNSFKFDAAPDPREPNAEKTKYVAAGKEACASLKCFKYEIIEPGASGKQYIWFDTRDYLLRRMQTTSDTEGAIDMTFTYNKPVITAPSPTKKLPASGQLTVPSPL